MSCGGVFVSELNAKSQRMNLFDNGQELGVLLCWQIPGLLVLFSFLLLPERQKYECFVEDLCKCWVSQICHFILFFISWQMVAWFYIYINIFCNINFVMYVLCLVVKQLNGYTKFYSIKSFLQVSYCSFIAYLLLFGCVIALYIWFVLRYFCKNTVKLKQQCLSSVQIRMVCILLFLLCLSQKLSGI